MIQSLTINEVINLCSLPVVGALIGWGTNYLAIKMLFHPRHPRRILGLSLQGVFPKRQEAFAAKVGEVVSTELLSADDIKRALQDGATADEIVNLIEEHIDAIISRKLPVVLPVISAFLNAPLISRIKELVKDELRGAASEITDKVAQRLGHRIDVHSIVRRKVAGFSSEKLEEIVMVIMRRELRFIEISGGVLGFLVGLGQAAIMILI